MCGWIFVRCQVSSSALSGQVDIIGNNIIHINLLVVIEWRLLVCQKFSKQILVYLALKYLVRLRTVVERIVKEREGVESPQNIV